jgi:hypothetical protein
LGEERHGSSFSPNGGSAIVSTGAEAPEIQNNDETDRFEGGVARYASTQAKTHLLREVDARFVNASNRLFALAR